MTVAALTAKDFQEPLLQALYDMSEGQPGVPQACDEVYTRVFQIMGIQDPEEYGREPGTDVLFPVRWTQWANRALRASGFTESVGKGQWSLTPSGVTRMTTVEEEPMHPQPAPPTLEIILHEDPYIQSLILANTGCFGYYSGHKGAICVTCPARTLCQDELWVRVEKFLGKPQETTPIVPATPKVQFDRGSMQRIRQRTEVACAECGSNIQANQFCYWKDDPVTRRAILVHEVCP